MFWITAQSGVPVVLLLYRPDIICGMSFSFRGVDVLFFFGALLDINARISSIRIYSPGGRLSITTPIPAP